MNESAKVLTSGSRFVFWTLGPFLLICFVIFGLLAIPFYGIKEWIPALILTVLSLGCFLLFLTLLNSKRYAWAFRATTGIVAMAFTFYVIHEFFIEKESFKITFSRSESTPRNALIGFLVVGLPCFAITIFGMPKKKEISDNQSVDTTPVSTPR